jgi:aminoglycoside 3-N-acetyltransferase
MRDVTLAQVVESLTAVGIRAGDGVLVHAAIQYLGSPVGGVDTYWQAFNNVLGPDGTLAVPTFTFIFARGRPYDPGNTSSDQMGVFAEHIRTLPGAVRSPHPLQSVAVIGRHATEIASRDTPCAFDPGSAFEGMLDLDFTMVLLGASIRVASIVHYSEQKAQVPYRIWKTFTGTLIRDGKEVPATCRMYARDLGLDPQNDFTPVQTLLERRKLWRQVKLNYGSIAASKLRDVVSAADDLLKEDPWALVKDGEAMRRRAEVKGDVPG